MFNKDKAGTIRVYGSFNGKYTEEQLLEMFKTKIQERGYISYTEEFEDDDWLQTTIYPTDEDGLYVVYRIDDWEDWYHVNLVLSERAMLEILNIK